MKGEIDTNKFVNGEAKFVLMTSKTMLIDLNWYVGMGILYDFQNIKLIYKMYRINKLNI